MTASADANGGKPPPTSMTPARLASIRYGARLAAAVLLAFVTSALLHLPEGFWAVMSALIVVRPSTGSTLNAGWDRVRGAATGTVLGLGGVALRHAMGGSEVAASIAPLVLVTALAFGAGLTPALRSAPISALIVVTSGGIPGHSAGQVALMRALEIAIGVGAALLVSLADGKSRATVRFRAAAAEQLRATAAALQADPTAGRDAAAETAAAEARRAAIRELVILAGAADHETRWLRTLRSARNAPVDNERHRRSALLVARTSSDSALFARARQLGVSTRGQPARAAAADAVDPPAPTAEQHAASRLTALADALETGRPLAGEPEPASTGDRIGTHGATLAFVMGLLDDDVRGLARLEGLSARPVP